MEIRTFERGGELHYYAIGASFTKEQIYNELLETLAYPERVTEEQKQQIMDRLTPEVCQNFVDSYEDDFHEQVSEHAEMEDLVENFASEIIKISEIILEEDEYEMYGLYIEDSDGGDTLDCRSLDEGLGVEVILVDDDRIAVRMEVPHFEYDMDIDEDSIDLMAGELKEASKFVRIMEQLSYEKGEVFGKDSVGAGGRHDEEDGPFIQWHLSRAGFDKVIVLMDSETPGRPETYRQVSLEKALNIAE